MQHRDVSPKSTTGTHTSPGDYPHLGPTQARNHAVRSAVLRDVAQCLSKRDSERLPGLQRRKIASFDGAQDAILLVLALVGNHQTSRFAQS